MVQSAFGYGFGFATDRVSDTFNKKENWYFVFTYNPIHILDVMNNDSVILCVINIFE